MCPNCGTATAAGQRFCDECGAPLATPCASCGASNRAGAKFCSECGTSLVGTAVRQGDEAGLAPARVAERRLVSVLFADLVGFTSLAEGRDAETVRDLLSRYFAIATDVVGRYGGTLEKFIGDAVMAVWGAPAAHEDDAERAVRAALDLVATVRELGTGVTARAGVMTGEAAVTVGATNQGLVAGDLVNSASRLQSVAPPGWVLIDEVTQNAVAPAIVCEQVGEQQLKGKAAPVAAWRAVRVVAEVGGVNRSDRLEAPFVGRDEEMRLLRELLHATGRERRPRLVSILGQAGIGKSRLVWELLKYVDGLVETVYWHQGRSPSYGEGITFWALGEMVRSRARVAETDDEATTRRGVAQALAEHVPDEGERRWIEAALLALLGLGDTPPGGREELFAAWRTFFERIARSGTVALVFEDLHWADPGLLDFIDHLLETSRDAPIYLLTLARPELIERRPDWGMGKRSFVGLHLEPLQPPEMTELLEGLVPGLHADATRAVVERADGIPLYAVETVRMLLATGQLVEQPGGAYAPAGELRQLAVPSSLHALIAARLDALDPAQRSLLADAAVLGQTFTVAALAEVSGEDPAQLEPRLRQLVRRELLVQGNDPRSPERGQYGFVQSLVREVAYGTLAHGDRRRRHLAAARYFESLGDDELAGVLAAHYLAAYRESPEGPERHAVAIQARLALRGAAERAIALGSPDHAVGYLEQALAVTPELADRAAVLERAGEAASDAGRTDDALRVLTAALALRRELGQQAAEAHATALIGRSLLNVSRWEQALEVLEPASRDLGDLADERAGVELAAQLARAYMFAENHDAAIEWIDRLLPHAERHGLAEIIADALVTRGTALVAAARPLEGTTVLRGALEFAIRESFLGARLRATINLGGILAVTDPATARALLHDAMQLADRLGLRSYVPPMGGNMLEALYRLGEWDRLTSELAALLDRPMDEIDRYTLRAMGLILSAQRGELDPLELEAARAEARRIDAAETTEYLSLLELAAAFANGHYATAMSIALERSYNSTNMPIALSTAGHAAAHLRDRARLEHVARRLDEMFVLGGVSAAWRVAFDAACAALDGRRAEALDGFRGALDRLRSAGAFWEQALCAVDCVAVLGAEDPEARAVGEEAAEILERLRAAPITSRLHALLAGEPPEPIQRARRADAPVGLTAD